MEKRLAPYYLSIQGQNICTPSPLKFLQGHRRLVVFFHARSSPAQSARINWPCLHFAICHKWSPRPSQSPTRQLTDDGKIKEETNPRLRKKQTQDYDGSCLASSCTSPFPRIMPKFCLLRVSQRLQLGTWERAQLRWIWSGHHGSMPCPENICTAWMIWFPQQNNARGHLLYTWISRTLQPSA